jgi:hypothetical protein
MPQTPSGKTTTDIITAARYDVNDSNTSGYFASDAEMLQWLNEGRIAISKLGRGLQTTESIDLVADTMEYTPANNYITIFAVQYVDSSGNVIALTNGAPSKVGKELTCDFPEFWYEFDGKVSVYPTLSSVTTETVKLFEVPIVSDLTSGEDIDTPADVDAELIAYIVGKHMFKDAKWASSAQVMAGIR